MKNFLLIIALLLSANLLADNTTHTYLYTFTQPTFNSTINASSSQTLNLNNVDVTLAATTSNASISYDNGLKIMSGSKNNHTIVQIAPKFSTQKQINSMTIVLESTECNSNTSNLYDFTYSGGFYNCSIVVPTSISSISHTYNGSYYGPKFVLLIPAGNSVTIHSLSFTYTDSNPSPDYHLFDQGSEIGTLTASSTYTLPSLPSSSQFDFYGWTPSTTTYFNSPTAPSTTILTIPDTSTTLYSCYSHPRPMANATPTILKLSNDTNPTTLAVFSFTPTTDIHLTSACFNLKRDLNNDNPVTLKADTNGITFADTLLDQKYVSKTSFNYHTLFADAIIPVKANTAVTFKASQSQGSTNCDTLILSYYDDSSLERRFYSIPPSFDALHIHLTDSTSLSSDRTAIDDISYTTTIDDSRYFFFSLPFAVPYRNISFSPITGPLPLTYYYGYENDSYLGDWVISRYDEHNNEWIDIELPEIQQNGLQPNVGYTIGLSQPNCTTAVTFRSAYPSGNTPHSISTTQPETTLSLLYTSTDSTGSTKSAIDCGWNLIGNPYYTPLNSSAISTPYLLLPRTDTTTYHIIHPYSETLTDTLLPPFSSFFIQSPATSLTINPSSSTDNCQLTTDNCSQSTDNWQLTTENCHHFNLLCTDPNNYTSCLTILASSSYSPEYEIGADLRSLSPYDDITHDGLAIYAAPLGVGDTVTFSLPDGCTMDNLSIGQNISIPSSWHLHILDDSHLVIEDTTPHPTDIEDVNDIEDVTNIFTMDGKLLPTTNINLLPPGIYILIIHNRPHKILKQ